MLVREIVGRFGAVAAVSALLATCGCGAFFQCEGKASCTTASATTVSGDFAYVTNTTSGSTYIGQYNIASGSFVSLASVVSVPVTPGSMKVAPSNGFVYVAGLPSVGGIYLYTVSTAGVLTIGNSSTSLTSDLVGAMDISADGGYLFTVDSSGTILKEYTVNKSTGIITFAAAFTLPGTGCGFTVASATSPSVPTCSISVSPNKNYVAVGLYTVGVVIYPFNTTSGITSTAYSTLIQPAKATYGVTFDTNDVLYVSEANQVESFTASTGKTISTVANANTPVAIAQDGAKFVYTANVSTGAISTYSTSSGTLATVGSDLTTATAVSSLAVDNTSKFVVANGYNSSTGLQLFSIGSTGALTTLSSLGTGGLSTTAIPALVALSH